MKRWRKKPVVIEATRWWQNGDHPDDGPRDTEGKVVRYFRRPDVPADRLCQKCHEHMHIHGWIDTLEGGHIVCRGDWIITGVKGERYPCKPDIFLQTYEPESYTVPAQPARCDGRGKIRVHVNEDGAVFSPWPCNGCPACKPEHKDGAEEVARKVVDDWCNGHVRQYPDLVAALIAAIRADRAARQAPSPGCHYYGPDGTGAGTGTGIDITPPAPSPALGEKAGTIRVGHEVVAYDGAKFTGAGKPPDFIGLRTPARDALGEKVLALIEEFGFVWKEHEDDRNYAVVDEDATRKALAREVLALLEGRVH